MVETVVALLMFVGAEIKEHRIQVDPDTGKPSMSVCLKHKREATRVPAPNGIRNLKPNVWFCVSLLVPVLYSCCLTSL